jgi:hypothetical protein
MLEDAVASEPAQEAWARHWHAHMSRLPHDLAGDDLRAEFATGKRAPPASSAPGRSGGAA